MNVRTIVWGILLAAVPLGAQEAANKLKDLDPALMDKSVDPCVNFYQYSCGGWRKQNSIPADSARYGRPNEIIDENQLVLREILEKAAAGGPSRSANEQKIGDYYAACMNVDAVNKAGLTGVQPLLDRIAAARSKDELPELAAYLDGVGVNTFFALGSDQDFKDATQQIAVLDQTRLGLPEKGYYERKDDKTAKLRTQYQAEVARTFE